MKVLNLKGQGRDLLEILKAGESFELGEASMRLIKNLEFGESIKVINRVL